MPKKPGPFDALGAGLKSLIGDAMRAGKGDIATVIEGLGDAMATPKALATLAHHSDTVAVWQLHTEPAVMIAIYNPTVGDPFVAAAIVQEDAAELADSLVNAVQDIARKKGIQ